jgi:FtsP/CotA-like multicopper oxidase with cupredoxin domain
MRIATVAMCAILLADAAPGRERHPAIARGRSPERIVVNDNRTPAGTIADGVLTIRLEAREGEWHPDRDSDPGLLVRAFAEEGQPLRIPGPLIRVPEGTTIHAFVRNSLRDSVLVVDGLSPRGAAGDPAADAIRVKPGEVREVRFAAGAAGTYYYRGTTNSGAVASFGTVDSELTGAFVVDPRGTTGPARDRVFVIALWSKSATPGGIVNRSDALRFSINGKAWPNTERLAYDVGDTVRFRVLNTSLAVHPMHLHGFYFNVDSRGDGTRDSTYDPSGSPRRVVTERLAAGRTFTMHWVPERAGYWLFHCHDNFHVLRNAPLDGSRLVPEHELHVQNHALEMMGGLVMGVEVRDQGTVQAPAEPVARRRLRLIARVDSGGTVTEPAYRYELQDDARRYPSAGPRRGGPTILLKRGEPVSITVVNELPEATAVHWHGIELDSYYDGVAGFAGHPGHIAPAIVPRDSFEARFTPPRAGTFIYHPHADEVRQQQAGLSGAIVVLDTPETFDAAHDIVLLFSVPRLKADSAVVFVNGTKSPLGHDLRVGERYRLRLINIHTARPSMIMRLLRESTPVTWRAVAKDGMELPADQATVRPAILQMGNGETYDFELTLATPGDLRFTVSSGAGALLASMPVRVR